MAFERVRKGPCSLCAPKRCSCEQTMRSLEKEANRWARAKCAKLPSEIDTGRLLGDTFVTVEQLQALETKRENAKEMREYLALLESRLKAIDHARHSHAAERRKIETQIEILRMRYQGEGKDEKAIARAFGRRSHSWASERLAEIYAEAEERLREVGSVAVICARAGCNRLVPPAEGAGRPAKYHSKACRDAARARRYRARKAAARASRKSSRNSREGTRGAGIERTSNTPETASR